MDRLERQVICQIVQNQSLTEEICNNLKLFGWKFDQKYRNHKKIILSPWSELKMNNQSESTIELQTNADYFINRTNLTKFLIETGSCRFEPKSLQSNNSQLSVCSSSIHSDEITHSNSNTNNNNNQISSSNNYSKSIRSSRGNQSIQKNNNDNIETRKKDRCPHLKNVGLERTLKDIINSAGDNYLFPRISSVLVDLGWKLNVQTTKYIQESVIISPWGWRVCENSKDTEMTLIHGCDFFLDNKEVVAYILEHGNQPYHVTGSNNLPLSTSQLKLREISQTTKKPSTNKIITTNSTSSELKLTKPSNIIEPSPIKIQKKETEIPLSTKKSNIDYGEFKKLQRELVEQVNTAGDNYLFPIISTTLVLLGWKLAVKVVSGVDTLGQNVIISPWGWLKYLSTTHENR